ncbi:MAG: NAD(P)H-dependent oxidoreductase [Pseudomonadota bacterium]
MNTAVDRILHIDSSARGDGSVTRDLSARVARRLSTKGAHVTYRDLALSPVPLVDASWVEANFTAPDQRTPAQREALAFSDQLVDELIAHDALVVGAPIYNFGVPAALKAWIDQVARVHRTFRYSSEGPQGLLTGMRAVVVVASGGTPLGAPFDFASSYLRHVLGFVGISDIELIDAGAPVANALERATDQIDSLALARIAA